MWKFLLWTSPFPCFFPIVSAPGQSLYFLDLRALLSSCFLFSSSTMPVLLISFPKPYDERPPSGLETFEHFGEHSSSLLCPLASSQLSFSSPRRRVPHRIFRPMIRVSDHFTLKLFPVCYRGPDRPPSPLFFLTHIGPHQHGSPPSPAPKLGRVLGKIPPPSPLAELSLPPPPPSLIFLPPRSHNPSPTARCPQSFFSAPFLSPLISPDSKATLPFSPPVLLWTRSPFYPYC